MHQLNPGRFPVYPGAISNSRTFPGVADTLMQANKTTMTTTCEKNSHTPFVSVLQACQWSSHKFLAAQTGASCDQNPRASSDRKVSSVHCTCSHKPPYQLVEMLKNMYFLQVKYCSIFVFFLEDLKKSLQTSLGYYSVGAKMHLSEYSMGNQ